MFKAEPLKKVQTDFHPREPHGKVRLLDYARRKSHRLGIAMRKIPLLLLKIYNIQVVRISPHGKLLATGGDDGHLRVWSFPDLAKVMVMLFLIFPRQGDVKYNIFDSNVM